MSVIPPLILSDSNLSFGVFSSDVDIYGKLSATSATIPNLSTTSGTFDTISATTAIFTNLGVTNATFTDISSLNQSIVNLEVTNLTGLSQFTLFPFSTTQFSVTTLTLSGSSVYNNLYFSNTSDPTFIKLPTASSITSASSALEDGSGPASDFWIMANTGAITLNENPPNVAFNFIAGQTLTIPSQSIGHFKIYSPAAGIYRVFSLGISSYV